MASDERKYEVWYTTGFSTIPKMIHVFADRPEDAAQYCRENGVGYSSGVIYPDSIIRVVEA